MTAPRPLSLAHLTLFDVAPPELVTVAAAAGFGWVGIRITPSRQGPAYPMEPGSLMLRDTVRRLDECGVSVLDIEVIRLAADTDPAACEPFLETAAALGARHIIVAVTDPDVARATQRFAELCELAAVHRITCVLEFMIFSTVRTFADGVALVTAAGQPNGAVLVDALHLARSGSTVAEVAATPRQLLPYAQFCDAAVDTLATDVESAEDEARHWRLLTGEGSLPLAGLLEALPAGAALSLEIPNGWHNPDPFGRAREVLRAAERTLAVA
jgi:sugar phosphate isomerase/epimerase